MTAPIAPVVHVGSVDRECTIGIVLAPSPGLSRVRVLNQATIGPVGSQDVEGDLPHVSQARQVPNPDGTYRWLLSWHSIDECAKVTP